MSQLSGHISLVLAGFKLELVQIDLDLNVSVRIGYWPSSLSLCATRLLYRVISVGSIQLGKVWSDK